MTGSIETATNEYLLSFNCPDQLGIMGRVTSLMYELGAFCTESSHYSDLETETFFMRTIFDDRVLKCTIEDFKLQFSELAKTLQIDFKLRSVKQKPRVVIAVSKYDHCLNVLLTKWRSGALNIDVVAVVSNHDDCKSMVDWYGVPFFHFPITNETKSEQETKILTVMDEKKADLLVLARYMQILSDDMCTSLNGRAINIHHSFLPGFKGARPYHQAHKRGVKIIGATAHYVTADLDEGPIIVQELKEINHTHTAEQMVILGQDNESTALSHAVRLHCEDRVILNGERTVIL
jgi:formyltetrahydrofolate deformylase